VVVAKSLERMEKAGQPSTTTPPSLNQVKETEVPDNSQSVLDLLSEAGRVPEALARRLRKGADDPS